MAARTANSAGGQSTRKRSLSATNATCNKRVRKEERESCDATHLSCGKSGSDADVTQAADTPRTNTVEAADGEFWQQMAFKSLQEACVAAGAPAGIVAKMMDYGTVLLAQASFDPPHRTRLAWRECYRKMLYNESAVVRMTRTIYAQTLARYIVEQKILGRSSVMHAARWEWHKTRSSMAKKPAWLSKLARSETYGSA